MEMQVRLDEPELVLSMLGGAAEKQKGYYFNRIQQHLRLTRNFYW